MRVKYVTAAMPRIAAATRNIHLLIVSSIAGVGTLRDARVARTTPWRGWAPLRRRLRLLQQDAAQVAHSSAVLDRVFGRSAPARTPVSSRAEWN